MTKSVISQSFIAFAREHFRLDWTGIHGAPHWSRVRLNGLKLGNYYGVDTEVIEWFAFLHDLERRNDDQDLAHGERAAILAERLNKTYMKLSADRLLLLQTACMFHSDGKQLGDPTCMVCWDADRLDLGRVGIEPNPDKLCTRLAKDPDFIDECWRRSVYGYWKL